MNERFKKIMDLKAGRILIRNHLQRLVARG